MTRCERCGDDAEKTKRIICNGRAWGVFCFDCHDVLAQVALAEWPVAPGAVLYEDRPDTPEDERRLHHVTDRRIDPDTGDQYLVIWDGTHTVEYHYHVDDVLGDFAPAGWQWPTGSKPTYHLTRNCGVDDKQDLMSGASP